MLYNRQSIFRIVSRQQIHLLITPLLASASCPHPLLGCFLFFPELVLSLELLAIGLCFSLLSPLFISNPNPRIRIESPLKLLHFHCFPRRPNPNRPERYQTYRVAGSLGRCINIRYAKGFRKVAQWVRFKIRFQFGFFMAFEFLPKTSASCWSLWNSGKNLTKDMPRTFAGNSKGIKIELKIEF